MSWTRLLSERSWYFWFCATDSQPAVRSGCPDGGLSASEQHHSPREGDRLVGIGEADVLHRLSLHASMRDTIQALTERRRSRSASGGRMAK